MIRLSLALFFSFLASTALAEKRVAFLVGNSQYEQAPALRNPGADIGLISQTLAELDFTVAEHYNLSRRDIAGELTRFLDENSDADVTLFYFAGHGMQFENRNYLLGTDANLQSTFDIEAYGLDLNRVIDLLAQKSKAALVFVDACRDNPLATGFYRRNFSETRASMTRGLARVGQAFNGTMITFSASPGQVAFDGEGEHSPFAAALARHLPSQNMEVLSLMKRVTRDVRSATANQQTPLVTNDLVQEIFLKRGEGAEAAAIAYREEERLFEAAKAINTPRVWRVFLDRYPDGSFTEAALREQETANAIQLAAMSGSTAPQAFVRSSAESGQRLDLSGEALKALEASTGITSDDIRKAQAALNERGYNVGPVDGVIGRGTRQGIADFQAAMSLPSTGALTAGTARALGISVSTTESDETTFIASNNARKYDALQLALFEDDPRLLRAAETLRDKEFTYGFHDGKLYLAVLSWCCPPFDEMQRIAERAGGYLATPTTPRENDFIVRLVRDDQRFWENHGDWISGPTIGLYQKPGSREPDGGWVWVTGEPSNWINWDMDMPNNNRGTAAIGAYGHPPRNAEYWRPGRGIGTWDDYNGTTRSFVIEID